MTASPNCFVFSTVLVATLCAGAARADFIISAPDISAAPGSSGSFEILLSATGSSAANIGAFSFDISTAGSNLAFTGATPTGGAARYIFAGDSFVAINGFPFATRTGQELTASDLSNNGVPVFVAAPNVFSLGTVLYSISPSAASGLLPITFSISGTSLSSPSGQGVPFTTANGQITITPEPTEITLLVAALGVLALRRVWHRQGRP